MMEQMKIWQALKGVRGKKTIDADALASLLTQFSQLVIDEPWIAEIDINPLIASPEGCIALDARVVIHGKEMSFENLPRPAMMSKAVYGVLNEK
jgi:acetyltransferase